MQSEFIRTACCDAPITMSNYDVYADIIHCVRCGKVIGFRPLTDTFAFDALLFKFAWRIGMFSVTDRLSHFIRNIT